MENEELQYMDEKAKKSMEEFFVKSLEVQRDSKADKEYEEPDDGSFNGRWRRLGKRKWELKFNDSILATVFRKPTDKWSLWINSPTMLEKVTSMTYRTHMYDSFEEATAALPGLYREKAENWCKIVLEYLEKTNAN